LKVVPVASGTVLLGFLYHVNIPPTGALVTVNVGASVEQTILLGATGAGGDLIIYITIESQTY
jgi:hypothetical protein